MNFYERMLMRKLANLAIATAALSTAAYAYMTSESFKKATDNALTKAEELCRKTGKEVADIAKEFLDDMKKTEVKTDDEIIEIEEESSVEKIDIE